MFAFLVLKPGYVDLYSKVTFFLLFEVIFLVFSLSLGIHTIYELWLSTDLHIFCLTVAAKATCAFSFVVFLEYIFRRVEVKVGSYLFVALEIVLQRSSSADSLGTLEHLENFIRCESSFSTVMTTKRKNLITFFLHCIVKTLHEVFYDQIIFLAFFCFNLKLFVEINILFFKLAFFNVDALNVFFKFFIVDTFFLGSTTPQSTFWDTSAKTMFVRSR